MTLLDTARAYLDACDQFLAAKSADDRDQLRSYIVTRRDALRRTVKDEPTRIASVIVFLEACADEDECFCAELAGLFPCDQCQFLTAAAVLRGECESVIRQH